jgi:Leucine-rich repeat (LRR) protein
MRPDAVNGEAAKREQAEWLKAAQALPDPEQRLAEVIKRLKLLNAGYDGAELHQSRGVSVTELTLRSSALHDIVPLAALSGLRVLICEGVIAGNAPPLLNHVTDLSPLGKLPLERLSLRYSSVADLSPLASTIRMHLTSLNISNTGVEDLSPLRGAALTQLICRQTRVSSLEPLRALKLTYLDCSGSPVANIEPLRDMPLEHVGLRNSRVNDIAPLAGKPLTFLDVENTTVSDLSPLKGAPLKTLYFPARNSAEGAAVLYLPKIELVNDMTPAEFGAKFRITVSPPATADAAPPTSQPPAPTPPAIPQAPLPPVTPPAIVAAAPEQPAAPNSFVSLDLATGFNADFISTYSHVWDVNANFFQSFNWETAGWQKAQGKKETGLPDDGRIEIPGSKANYFQLNTSTPHNAIKLTGPIGTQPRPVVLVLQKQQAQRYSKIALLQAATGVSTLLVTLRYGSGDPEIKRLTLIDFRSVPGADPTQAFSMFSFAYNASFTMYGHGLPIDPRRALRSITLAIDPADKAHPIDALFQAGVFAISALPAPGDTAEIGRAAVPEDVYDAWVKSVQALPVKEQARRVADKLKELNPGYSGTFTSKEELNQVSELSIQSDALENIAPVRALPRLKRLDCSGIVDAEKGIRYNKVLDLSPLKKLNLLSHLDLSATAVEDLSPVKGLSVYELNLSNTLVHDLTPIKVPQLRVLNISNTAVSSLAPLQGIKLERLIAAGCLFNDLTPLKSMPLRELNVSHTQISSFASLASAPLETLDVTGSKLAPEEAPKLAALPLRSFSAGDDYLEEVSQVLKQSRTLTAVNGQTIAEFRFRYPDVVLQENFERVDLQRPPIGWSFTDRQAFSIAEKRGRGKVLCINNKGETAGSPTLDIALDPNKFKGRTIVMSVLAMCPAGYTTASTTDKPVLLANYKVTTGKTMESVFVALEPNLSNLDWIPIKASATIPPNATTLSVCLRVNHIPVEVFFDDLKVELVPVQPPPKK